MNDSTKTTCINVDAGKFSYADIDRPRCSDVPSREAAVIDVVQELLDTVKSGLRLKLIDNRLRGVAFDGTAFVVCLDDHRDEATVENMIGDRRA